jgi:hypothetical protein
MKSRWILAAAGLCLIVSHAARADFNPAMIPRVASVAAITSGHLGQYKQIYLSGYGNGTLISGDGGEGNFTQVTSCTDDDGSCFHDVDGIAFRRDNLNGDLRQFGLTAGSIYDGATNHSPNPQGAANRVTAAMTVLKAAGLGLVHITINIYMGQDFTVLPEMTIDCGWSPFAQNVDDDFRYVTEHGIISHPSTTKFLGQEVRFCESAELHVSSQRRDEAADDILSRPQHAMRSISSPSSQGRAFRSMTQTASHWRMLRFTASPIAFTLRTSPGARRVRATITSIATGGCIFTISALTAVSLMFASRPHSDGRSGKQQLAFPSAI